MTEQALMTLEDIQSYLRSVGLTAEERGADSAFRFLGVEGSGFVFNLILYGPETEGRRGGCGDVIQVHGRFKIPSFPADRKLTVVNLWNMSKVFGRAHVDGAGDFVLEMTFVHKDAPTENLGRHIVQWLETLAQYKDFLQNGGAFAA